MRIITLIGFSIGIFICTSSLIFYCKSTQEDVYHTILSKINSGTFIFRFSYLENNRPEVKINEPKNNSFYSLNTLIRYTISVSDVEDGESKYGEIPSDKVFLEIKFMEGTPPPSSSQENIIMEEPVGLTAIKNSDCFNCHQFKTKLTGPSFQEIANRYFEEVTSKTTLANHIREGSVGNWGDILMPAHNDLTSEEAENMINWILQNGTNPNYNILSGISGTFRLEKPADARDGYFALKASYSDKGLPHSDESQLTGQDILILQYQ